LVVPEEVDMNIDANLNVSFLDEYKFQAEVLIPVLTLLSEIELTRIQTIMEGAAYCDFC
jgi:hypothetical protein